MIGSHNDIGWIVSQMISSKEKPSRIYQNHTGIPLPPKYPVKEVDKQRTPRSVEPFPWIQSDSSNIGLRLYFIQTKISCLFGSICPRFCAFSASLTICGPTRNILWSTENSEVEGCYGVQRIGNIIRKPSPFLLWWVTCNSLLACSLILGAHYGRRIWTYVAWVKRQLASMRVGNPW